MEVILTVTLCIFRFILLQMNLIDLSEIKKKKIIHGFITLTAVIVVAPVRAQCIDAIEMYATERRR